MTGLLLFLIPDVLSDDRGQTRDMDTVRESESDPDRRDSSSATSSDSELGRSSNAQHCKLQHRLTNSS